MVLGPDRARGRLVARPRDDARVGRPTIEFVALPHLERRVERHRPAVRIVVVRLRPTELVEHGQVGFEVVRDPVEQQVLVDRPVRAALARGSVVRDQHHERALALARLLEKVEQPPDLVIGVRQEAGVDLGHPREQALLAIRQGVPRLRVLQRGEHLPVGTLARLRRADRVEWRELRVRWDEPELLLAGQGLLAHGLVAHVEAALVLVRPFLRGMVRRVGRSGRVIEEERLVRGDRLGVADELDRLVRDVDRQVVALLRGLRLIHRMVVVDEIRIPLVRLGAEEPVPALEPAAARPVAPGGREVHLVRRTEVPLADHVGVPAELSEDLRQHPVLGRDDGAAIGEAGRTLGDARHAVAGVVAPGQQARAGRGAQRGRVPLRVAHAVGGDAIDVGRLDRAAIAVHRGEADVVEHDVHDVRRAVGRPGCPERFPVRDGVADVDVDRALERLRHDGPSRSPADRRSHTMSRVALAGPGPLPQRSGTSRGMDADAIVAEVYARG